MNLQRKTSLFLLLMLFINIIVPVQTIIANSIIPEGWISYTNDLCGFTIYLPEESILQSEFETAEYLSVTLPILDNETNLSEKYLEIECSFDPASRELYGPYPSEVVEKVFNQTTFWVQNGSEGAAGSVYQSEKYSTEQNSKYALFTFVMRSGNPGIPGGSQIEFDYEYESAIFEEIMNTFIWGIPSISTPIPLITITPDSSITTPFVTTQCPFENSFQKKQEIIYFLQSPPQISDLETGVAIPLPILDPPKWRYDETDAQNLLNTLRRECENYINGSMTSEQKLQFENTMMTFKRLTYTEIALESMYPQFLNVAYETSQSISEILVGSVFALVEIGKLGNWFSEKSPSLKKLIGELLDNTISFLLDLIDTFLNHFIAKMEDFGRMAQFTFHPLLQMIQSYADPVNGGTDIFKESIVQKVISGLFLAKYVEITQSEIDIAVANVPLGRDTSFPYLSMTGVDLEAEQAIYSLVQKSTQDTEQAITVIQAWNTNAENVDIVSNVSQLSSTGLLIISPVTGPGASVTAPVAAYLQQLSTIMKVLALAVHGVAVETGLEHLDQVNLYATNSADIAFDPSKLSTLLAQENQIINLDVASLDFVPANHIPASVYYSRYQIQIFNSVDSYKAGIERLTLAIESGQDEQIQIASEELLQISEELRESLKIAETPLNDMPFNRSEVQNLDFSIQDLRAQSVALHVALIAYMVEKTSPEIQKETQTIVSDVFDSVDNFKTNYETLSQSGLAIPAKFLPVILGVKTPEIIIQGESFLMTVKISNVGQTSQQSPITLSVTGGDKILTSTNQALLEITPSSQVEIPLNLTALKSGHEFAVVEIIQDENVIASKVVWLEITNPENSFVLPYTSYLLLGGLGLLCFSAFVLGGVFIFTGSRTSKRSNKTSIRNSQKPQSTSNSNEQIKKAVGLARSKHYQEAFEILRQVVKSEPNNRTAWFNLGGVLINIGNYKDAEKCFSRAKQLGHPKADEALDWLSHKR